MSNSFTVSMLSDMMYDIESSLVAKGIKKDRATEVAFEVVDKMRRNFGGITIFIPKDRSLDKIIRDSEIFRSFTGRNHEALAMQYGLSMQQIYRIVDAARGDHHKEHYGEQGEMNM